MDRSGTPSCWTPSGPPIVVPTAEPLASVTASGDGACGLTADGRAYCWTYSLPMGEQQLVLPAVLLSGGLRFRTLHGGPDAICGMATDGLWYCWDLYPSVGAPQRVPGGA